MFAVSVNKPVTDVLCEEIERLFPSKTSTRWQLPARIIAGDDDNTAVVVFAFLARFRNCAPVLLKFGTVKVDERSIADFGVFMFDCGVGVYRAITSSDSSDYTQMQTRFSGIDVSKTEEWPRFLFGENVVAMYHSPSKFIRTYTTDAKTSKV